MSGVAKLWAVGLVVGKGAMEFGGGKLLLHEEVFLLSKDRRARGHIKLAAELWVQQTQAFPDEPGICFANHCDMFDGYSVDLTLQQGEAR